MPHTSTARPTVAPAGMPEMVTEPWSRLRSPVPLAAAPHGLQASAVPTGTIADAGPAAAVLLPFALTAFVTVPLAGARQPSATVAVAPAAMSPSGTLTVAPGPG